MKPFFWVLAGASFAVAAYIILNQPGPEYGTGSDDVEFAARRATSWGSKQRLSGAGAGLGGKLKEGFGQVTGDDELASEGVADQVVGAIKDTAGKAAQVAGETLHEVNR
jgi:uncharacterized protein YjbJ (UPF0337 family)